MAKYNNYKDTGIPWIGQIPLEWEVKRNKNVFSCNKNIVGSESSSTQLLSLTTNGIRKKNIDETGGKIPESYDTYQHVKANDIVMCLFDLDCSAVFSGLSKYDGMISPAYKILRCNESIMPGFADYWFRSVFVGRKFKYLAKNIRYSLTYEDFSALEIPCPTLIEQKAIVDYLDCVCSNVDSIIAEAQASIEEYKAWKSSIIYEAVTKGLDSNVEMKDSGVEWFGKVPARWSCMKLRYALDNISDVDHFMPESTSDGVPYIMTGDLKNTFSQINFENCKKIAYDDYIKLSQKSRIKEDDVIFARYATIGTVSYVDMDINCIISYSCVLVSPNKTKLLGRFLFYYLQSEAFKNEVGKYINTNIQGNVGKDSMFRAKIILPPLEEQSKIVVYLDDRCKYVDDLIVEKENLIMDLESYKKSLIFEVVTGKRKVV